MAHLRQIATAVAAAGALVLSGLTAAPALAAAAPTFKTLVVPAVTVQTTTATKAIELSVTISDPDDVIDEGVDFVLTQGGTVVTGDSIFEPTSVDGTDKTYEATLLHESGDPWGQFRLYLDAYSSTSQDPVISTSVLTAIKAQSTATNTPSLTTINKGQAFVERGFLRRFNGTPLSGQKVSIYYVPAGQTKASFAGYATTTSTGAFSLTVRAWYTGSWFVSYPGSIAATSTYKGAWVRVR